MAGRSLWLVALVAVGVLFGVDRCHRRAEAGAAALAAAREDVVRAEADAARLRVVVSAMQQRYDDAVKPHEGAVAGSDVAAGTTDGSMGRLREQVARARAAARDSAATVAALRFRLDSLSDAVVATMGALVAERAARAEERLLAAARIQQAETLIATQAEENATLRVLDVSQKRVIAVLEEQAKCGWWVVKCPTRVQTAIGTAVVVSVGWAALVFRGG